MQNLLISHQDSAGPSFHTDQMLKRWGIKQPFYIVRSANLHWFNDLFPTEKCLEIHLLPERTVWTLKPTHRPALLGFFHCWAPALHGFVVTLSPPLKSSCAACRLRCGLEVQGFADTSEMFCFAVDARFIWRQPWDETCYSPQWDTRHEL